MEELTSPPAHSCAHCADIVFPGSPEEIYVTNFGPPEDPFGNFRFQKETMNRLELSLADLRLRANAGCDFAHYLKDDLEYKFREKYRDANPDAIQLYILLEDYRSIVIQPLMCLQGLHLPDNVFEGRDVSRCFVSTGWHRGLPYIYCTLANITGDDSHEEIKIRKSIVQDPLSDRTVTNVRDWLKRCEDEQHGYHKICSLSERAYVPTRLIKISGRPDQLQLKIVCRDDLEEHDVSRYVALSYCWGGDQTNKLTQENYGLYKKNIAWETLPKTIQDAAKTAQTLGFQYIWIDSMCIVQNSKEDKEAEINQMTKVYAHATLTVVNSRSDRVTEGFLHPRTLPSATTSIQYRTTDGQTQRLTLLFNNALNSEESVAVNTRGWTLQEYLLSRRRLIIGTWSTEWHCRRKDEIHTNGLARSTRMGPSAGIPYHVEDAGWAGPGPFGSKEAESVYSSSFINAAMFFSVNPGYPPGQVDKVLLRFSWTVIVTSYSKRSVTESEDRILALSGIAERFANLVPGRYIAGIWENMMPSCLYWYKFGRPVDRPVKYRGPSWSWISIDGQVEHILSDRCLCEILSVEYMLENAEALYGAVRNATLHIKGPALSIEWRYTRQDRQGQEDKELQEDLSELRWFRDGSDDPQGLQLSVQLDAREQTTEWGEAILLAYDKPKLNSSSFIFYCMLLIRVDQVEINKPQHWFRRLGNVGFSSISSPLPPVEGWPVSSYYVI